MSLDKNELARHALQQFTQSERMHHARLRRIRRRYKVALALVIFAAVILPTLLLTAVKVLR